MKTISLLVLILIMISNQSCGQVGGVEKIRIELAEAEKLIEKKGSGNLEKARDLMEAIRRELREYETLEIEIEKPIVDCTDESQICFMNKEFEFMELTKKFMELEIEFLYIENRQLVNELDKLNP